MPTPFVPGNDSDARAFAERMHTNQQRLAHDLQLSYDFIVCGAGSAGSVVAGRLAANPAVRVLLLEAGGTDEVPAVQDPAQWLANLGSERDWGFQAEPSPHLSGRALPYSMGKVLGGGSSINVSTWARGHRADWDFFAHEANDPAWGYEAVLGLYHRIEAYHGVPDPTRRGQRGPMYVQSSPEPHPFTLALLEAARSVGLPTFDSPNGRMMESDGGGAIVDEIVHDGQRQSPFRSYVYPLMDQPNLTVLTGALVTCLTFAGKQVTGVEFTYGGQTHRVTASAEVVLSLGAIQTPKVLMQSGIGDAAELARFNIPLVHHLPGVGQNLEDHAAYWCIWEATDLPLPTVPRGQAAFFWKNEAALDAPDSVAYAIPVPFATPENNARFTPPARCWSLGPGVRHKRRGYVGLTGPNASDPVVIQPNFLADPDDLRMARLSVEKCRAIGNSAAMRPYVKREVAPGDLSDAELERFLREGTVTYWHQCGTAKMGQDALAVVNGQLKVYGVEGLRIADASIMPRVTSGNTMAPCVVIGERASDLLKATHRC